MPRKRMIDPGIWDSEQVMSLGSEQFKLYVFLISQADDEGRLKNTPKIFRSRVHPIDDYPQEKFDQDFEAIIKCGLVKVYGGGLFLFHPNWRLYQKIDRPAPSKIPVPPDVEEVNNPTPPDESPHNKRAIPAESRRAIAKRYGVETKGQSAIVRCAYCGVEGKVVMTSDSYVTFPGLEIDHVIPESQGGDDSPENLVLACRSCNRKKGGNRRIPDGARQVIVPNRIEVNRKEYIAREKTEVAPDVFMAEDERAKLVAEYGEATTSAKINELSCALGNRIPKNKYKDHYKTVKNWIERDKQKAPPEPTKRTVKHKLCGSCGKEYFGSACTCGWSE